MLFCCCCVGGGRSNARVQLQMTIFMSPVLSTICCGPSFAILSFSSNLLFRSLYTPPCSLAVVPSLQVTTRSSAWEKYVGATGSECRCSPRLSPQRSWLQMLVSALDWPWYRMSSASFSSLLIPSQPLLAPTLKSNLVETTHGSHLS
jgi:hypothetical protein